MKRYWFFFLSKLMTFLHFSTALMLSHCPTSFPFSVCGLVHLCAHTQIVHGISFHGWVVSIAQLFAEVFICFPYTCVRAFPQYSGWVLCVFCSLPRMSPFLPLFLGFLLFLHKCIALYPAHLFRLPHHNYRFSGTVCGVLGPQAHDSCGKHQAPLLICCVRATLEHLGISKTKCIYNEVLCPQYSKGN